MTMTGFGMFMTGASCNTILQTHRRRGEEEPRDELLHDVLHRRRRPSATTSRDGSRSTSALRAPSSWTGARASRRASIFTLQPDDLPLAPEDRLREPRYHPRLGRHPRRQPMNDARRKDALHHGSLARHRARDRAARRARRRERGRRGQDFRAPSEARGHDPHRRRRDRGAPAARRSRSSSTCATRTAIAPGDATHGAKRSAASTSSSTTRARSASRRRSQTPAKRFDLMMGVNARATFLCSQACIPHLARSRPNAHILTLSPPLAMKARWFAGHVAYTMSKYGMSMCTLGMAEELRRQGIAVNSLWPRTTIATAAVEVHFPAAILAASRHARDHGRRRARDPHVATRAPPRATSTSTRTCCAAPA